MAAKRLRVKLRYIEILDRKDIDEYGEFRFHFKAGPPGRVRETHIPDASGHLKISDHPSMRKVARDDVLFEGEIREGESLVVEARGEELDSMSANDTLNAYRREFSGSLDGWVGEHGPWDEGGEETRDPEQLGDWRLAYAIEVLS